MGRTETQILFGRVSDLPQPRPQRGQSFTLTTALRASQSDQQEEQNPGPPTRVVGEQEQDGGPTQTNTA